MKKTKIWNAQYQMLAAFLCVLISKEWGEIQMDYTEHKAAKPDANVVLHVGYDSNAVPEMFVNDKNTKQESGWAFVLLKDEYFEDGTDARQAVAYLLADSLPTEG